MDSFMPDQPRGVFFQPTNPNEDKEGKTRVGNIAPETQKQGREVPPARNRFMKSKSKNEPRKNKKLETMKLIRRRFA
jgi:hypothetical protein